eukprot:TRINITY_DN5672_c0_g1_i3.p1 TRINITY_DN5672_c0_g1~~TRINITY_DN5672_c0_g1_i3.p1  ORF type:complete len:214 (+),score=34.02 TRINITY_DN5672_c0_g1_i3:61-702(+)
MHRTLALTVRHSSSKVSAKRRKKASKSTQSATSQPTQDEYEMQKPISPFFDRHPLEDGEGAKSYIDQTSAGTPADDYSYFELLSRVYDLQGPQLKIDSDLIRPGPKAIIIHRIGSTRMAWTNFFDYCTSIGRNPHHFAEWLARDMSIDCTFCQENELAFKNIIPAKELSLSAETYLKRFVICRVCHSPDTRLNQDYVGRWVVTCLQCMTRCLV